MELSIEEKAQRYDEAIEQLKAMMPNWERLSYTGKTFLQDLTYILPELKESEDEMIRRVLIQETKGSEVRLFEAVTNEEFIAWLEKKGGQDERIRRVLIKETEVPGAEFFRAVTKANEEFIARLRMQGEHKPTDKCDGCNNAKGCVACVDGSEWAHIEIADLKPYWSEEDEEMIEGLVNCLDELEKENGWNCVYVVGKSVELNKVRKWVKSLKERVQPQLQWKPSGEQMNALDNARHSNPFNVHILDTLFHKLKEIGEE